jgi:DUF1680 family protein
MTIPFYHNSTATIRFTDGGVKVRQSTGYPFDGAVSLEVVGSSSSQKKTVRFFAPSWSGGRNIVVHVNGQTVPVDFKDGFLVAQLPLTVGTVISFDLGVTLHSEPTFNRHTLKGYHTFNHGPLLLAMERSEEVRIEKVTDLVAVGKGKYRVKEKELVLAPLYDPDSLTHADSKKQVLF